MRKGKVSPAAAPSGDRGDHREHREQAAIPAIGEGKRGESGHLGYLLRQAAGGFRLCLERALADVDVTQPQFMVMTMIAAYPGASNADLARLALLTPQTLSTIIANLMRCMGGFSNCSSPKPGRNCWRNAAIAWRVSKPGCRAISRRMRSKSCGAGWSRWP